MILPDQTPKLPKWPFLVGDAALLGAAWLIAEDAAHPLPVEAVVAIVACVICAALAGTIPFVADYARRQDEALDTRQRSLEALERNATIAAEQISIAATGLRETADSAEKNLGQIEQLPRKLQEQLAAFATEAARNRMEEKKALEKELAALRTSAIERFEAAADKVLRAAADRAPEEKKSPPVVAQASPPALLSAPALPPIATEAEPPVPPDETKENLSAKISQGGTKAEAPIAPKPPRKRAPRKPAEPVLFQEELPKEILPNPDEVGAVPAASEFTQSSPEEVSPAASIAADGASRLLVTAYIGIGNRLFIRGEGPGLSWDKGVPLQFVSIGKWRWETNEAAAAIKFKLYKNDEIECPALGADTLEPGHQQEVTAAF